MDNDDILSLPRVLSSIKRGVRHIVLSVLCFLVVAVLYLLVATPKYTASTSILLDPTQAKTVSEISSKARRGFENEAIVSQVEIVKSRRVAEKALQYLYSESEFNQINADFVRKEKRLATLQKNLRVYREGESYILNIRYTDIDPKDAAEGANAFAQAYIYDQIHSFAEGSAKTSTWLKGKIESLRQQSVRADQAVQAFRVKNNLIDANGRSVNEQQLSNINAKLSNAKAEVAGASVRYDHSQEIIEKQDMSAALAEAFDNDVINAVRAEYIKDQQRLLKLTRTLGEEHQAVRGLKKELQEARNVIFAEMKRISQSYKNEYEIALAREKSLEESLEELISQKVQNDGQLFELEALEKEAESYKTLHNEYLEKYEVMNQQESFPVAESRIITEAVPPLKKSHPKTIIIIGMAFVLGLGVGVFWALLTDNFDKSFKRAGQIESASGLFFLGFFPKLDFGRLKRMLKNQKAGSLLFAHPAYRQSVESPLSLFAETCRNTKIRFDKKTGQSESKVIGVMADKPNFGKSVAAANLALFIAQSGSKCLLIDADVRNPILSQDNFVENSKGLNDALSKKKITRTMLLRDQKTDLYVLPNGQSNVSVEDKLLNASKMKELISSCIENFDYIVIDLPPLSATSDASGFSSFIDRFLLVLEWGKSKPNSLNFHLKQNDISKDQILGAILAQADMQEMMQNYDHEVYPEYTSI